MWSIGGIITDKEEEKKPKENPSSCYFVRHKFHIDYAGTETGLRRVKRVYILNNTLSNMHTF
jgi:hypothetical protein